MLAMRAYGIDEVRGPAWTDKIQFDVVANVPPGATAEQLRKMLQSLLEERFRMQVHRETRVVPVYELTVAKKAAARTISFQAVGPVRWTATTFPSCPLASRMLPAGTSRKARTAPFAC